MKAMHQPTHAQFMKHVTQLSCVWSSTYGKEVLRLSVTCLVFNLGLDQHVSIHMNSSSVGIIATNRQSPVLFTGWDVRS